jgi:hypothetical protein
MRLDRKHRDFAKKLARLSVGADGQIDPAHVNGVIEALHSYQPRVRRALLKSYLHFLTIEDRRGCLRYEYAGVIGPGELAALNQHFNQKYRRPLRLELQARDDLLAGVRVCIADDVYEYSAANRLNTLRTALT